MARAKYLSSFFSLFLTFSLLSYTYPASSAELKIGDRCTKQNQETKNAKQTLICTKLESGLSWQPSIREIEKAIWKDLQGQRNALPDVSTSLEVYYSPTVNKKLANVLLNSLNQAAKLWQVEYLPEKPLPTLFFTEKDRSWFIATMKSLNVYSTHQLSNFDDEVSRNGTRSNWAGVTGDGGRLWMTYMIGSSKKQPDLNDALLAAHEYTHLAQNRIANKGFDQLSCWQVEGGAAFYGMYLGAKDELQLSQIASDRRTQKNFGGFTGLVNQSPKSWEKLLDFYGPHFDNSKCGPDGAYPVGSVANEYLFTLKGHQGIIDAIRNVGESGDFYKGIEITYGKPWPQLRKEMANYLKLVAAQLS